MAWRISVLPGSKNRAQGHEGRSGTWETLPSPLTFPAREPEYQLPVPPTVRPGRWEQIGRKGGIAKRRQRSTARWTARNRSVP
jgi:hypothetical protein